MKSMTGFASIEAESEGLRLSLRLRCVNSRFFELKSQLPGEYLVLETEIKKRLQSQLYRASIELQIRRWVAPGGRAPKVFVHGSLAESYQRAFGVLAENLDLPLELSLRDFLKLPGLVVPEEAQKPSREERQFLFHCVEQLLAQCQKERIREGKATQSDLLRMLKLLEKECQAIERQRRRVLSQLEKKYLQRIEKLGMGLALDPQRLAQELVIQIDKTDITEELLRLQEHFREFRSLLQNSEEPVGKRLDFYCQELLREVNTIGSKAQTATITRHIVEAKGTIERMREIVQNVE